MQVFKVYFNIIYKNMIQIDIFNGILIFPDSSCQYL